ncbi:AzlD domain-containing protein [Halorientalis regularis]|jgi:branched-subunit amino acid transport protein|uniref:Branched-chain amino acid transport protein n=1 Tax=Halorientalis regularis TaxID=660518 RepID=A0A1G7K6Q6_9EURY|nr:AzlD domain-containing protein [Halorientalis regularis]SDF32988.1 Branched-chain amino acid transport protein [Halorientalis regularis]
MATSYADPLVWGVILVIGVLTFAIRLSFIGLFGYLDEIPPRLERPLRYVPAAVLAALVLPAFVTLEASGLAADKLVAGGLAALVAWRTENVFATMAAGMGTLWLVRFLVLPAL